MYYYIIHNNTSISIFPNFCYAKKIICTRRSHTLTHSLITHSTHTHDVHTYTLLITHSGEDEGNSGDFGTDGGVTNGVGMATRRRGAVARLDPTSEDKGRAAARTVGAGSHGETSQGGG